MDQYVRASIRKTMEKKSTEKLKRIYTNHNDSWWAPESFEVIYQILLERGETVAPHSPEYSPQFSSPLPELQTPPSPSSKIFGGILSTLVGLFIYLWASRHSPYNPLGAMMMGGLESYVLKEPFYTVILLAAAGLGLLGISLLALGLIDRAKLP